MSEKAKPDRHPAPERRSDPEPKLPPPPRHLRPGTRCWWRELVRAYAFERHHLLLLEVAASAWDRAEQARELLDAAGILVVDRFDQTKAHPATVTERDSRTLFIKAMLSLGLDVPPPDGGRRRRSS